LGVRDNSIFMKCPRNLRIQIAGSKGLISVDRRTSLLSYLQYPVHSKSSTKDLITLSARKANNFGVGPKPIATREHREQNYHRFSAWILT
jgi:hypothetical protein